MSEGHVFSDTSPAAADTAVSASKAGALQRFGALTIIATLTGATGGTLDVYLQVSPDAGVTWYDYAHFAQLAAGAAAITKVITVSRAGQQTGIPTVGTGLSPALAANAVVGGDFGDMMRVLFVAGAGTSAGAVQTIKVIGTRSRR